ncbi:uncharacterized protein [Solanum lycopersicum]|uniref:uncharacterized protein isoform X3 n=1 Tax=Solanum lycopersicum TaxID=4081 RepID=UPI003747EFAC
MTEREGAGVSEELVYRISTMEEWELMQKTGSTFGGDLDRTTGFIHLSKLDQVQSTLLNFFLNVKDDLYLLQIDAKKKHEVTKFNEPVKNRRIEELKLIHKSKICKTRIRI